MKVRVVRQTKRQGWKATGLDHEVTSCILHLDSLKCSCLWRWGQELLYMAQGVCRGPCGASALCKTSLTWGRLGIEQNQLDSAGFVGWVHCLGRNRPLGEVLFKFSVFFCLNYTLLRLQISLEMVGPKARTMGLSLADHSSLWKQVLGQCLFVMNHQSVCLEMRCF